MRLHVRVSSGLERRIHVVPGNVRIQQRMTEDVLESPMLQNEQVRFDEWTRLCRRYEPI